MPPEDKPERLLNLLMLLLRASRPLTAAEIRERSPRYERQRTETFHRMFERDKHELRDMGFPIESEETPDGPGYRIRPGEALLDDPGLTADEQAALSLAAVAWGSGRDPNEATFGALKLSAFSADGPAAATWLLPRVALDRELPAILAAMARRKRVTFLYPPRGGGAPVARTVEPHGTVYKGGWYLVGHDVDRGEVRNFKLARMEGAVSVAAGPEPDFEAPAGRPEGPRAPWEGAGGVEARVLFSADVAWQVERARSGARVLATRDDGVEIALPASELESFAAWVTGFGDDALVLEPAELRTMVRARLVAIAEGT